MEYLSSSLIRQLSQLDLVARLVVDGMTSGQHMSPFYGFNIEFAEHRQYMPGDDVKHVDWKVLAKREKLYVKQYEESTSLKAMILLDVSRSMEFASRQLIPREESNADGDSANPAREDRYVEISKLLYSKYLVAALSYLMLSQKDSVGVVTFSDQVHEFIIPRSNPGHLHLILETIDKAKTGKKTGISETLERVAHQLKRRALIVVISDFLDDAEELLRGITYLKHLKHEPMLLQVLTPEELEFPYDRPARFIDMEDGSHLDLEPKVMRDEYKRLLGGFMERVSFECGYHKIDYQKFSTGDPVELVLSRYLMKRSRM